ncbi:hypothetical protein F5Y10DRAFT_35280 [Nemania abortiva]|nr:hypothetical protein F5Y10DRAFT_35280 [Nemania abortiva]
MIPVGRSLWLSCGLWQWKAKIVVRSTSDTSSLLGQLVLAMLSPVCQFHPRLRPPDFRPSSQIQLPLRINLPRWLPALSSKASP